MDIQLKILEENYQNQLKNNLYEFYSCKLNEYREDVTQDYENEHLSPKFQDFFKTAIFNESLNQFSNLNWYWLELVDRLVNLIYLHEELVISQEEFELSQSEDELFNFWHDSDYAKSFLEMLNDTKDLLSVSNYHKSLFEDQIISVFILQIANIASLSKTTYYNIPELGDSFERIYHSDSNCYANLNNTDSDKFSFYVSSTTKKVHLDGRHLLIDRKALNNAEHSIHIHSPTKAIDKELFDINERISRALTIIKKVNPKLYHSFINFTDIIVPINETGVVSYSMQSLPGHSSINMFERDFLDLIDDLLHENGHHIMNHFLNVEDVLDDENEEKIYYSPWRKALRPIRGIYHAYFTFFWAFLLYKSLSHSLEEVNKIYQLDDTETLKVHSRYIEEYFMITFCWDDIVKANQEGKVSDHGLFILQDLQDYLTAEDISESLTAIKQLDEDKYNELLSFKDDLLKIKDHYSQEC